MGVRFRSRDPGICRSGRVLLPVVRYRYRDRVHDMEVRSRAMEARPNRGSESGMDLARWYYWDAGFVLDFSQNVRQPV